jgi:hypothetical protein
MTTASVIKIRFNCLPVKPNVLDSPTFLSSRVLEINGFELFPSKSTVAGMVGNNRLDKSWLVSVTPSKTFSRSLCSQLVSLIKWKHLLTRFISFIGRDGSIKSGRDSSPSSSSIANHVSLFIFYIENIKAHSNINIQLSELSLLMLF